MSALVPESTAVIWTSATFLLAAAISVNVPAVPKPVSAVPFERNGHRQHRWCRRRSRLVCARDHVGQAVTVEVAGVDATDATGSLGGEIIVGIVTVHSDEAGLGERWRCRQDRLEIAVAVDIAGREPGDQ